MKRSRSRGFTLTELMIATGLGSVVALGIFNIVRNHARSSTGQEVESEQLRSSQRARFLMEIDLAQAGFDPMHPTSPLTPLVNATNDHVSVQGDFNLSGELNDSAPGDAPETIDYLFDADGRQVTRNGQPFLLDVDSFTVSYFDASGTSILSPAPGDLTRIKRVRVQWKQNRLEKDKSQEINVYLRNYKAPSA